MEHKFLHQNTYPGNLLCLLLALKYTFNKEHMEHKLRKLNQS